jgi:DNA-binding transcriptional LysR family regulator
MVEPQPAPEITELSHVSTFVKAAELGSFTAAAVELGITQAAVSQRIAALEKELRTALFLRRAGTVRLTEAGKVLHDYGRKILDLHAEARQALGGIRPAISGELAVAASSVPGECLLPAWLPTFRDAFPQIHVRATVSDSGSALRDIEKGRATIGIVGTKSDNPKLEFRPIGADTLVLIVPSGHRFARRRAISLNDLRDEKLLIRESGSGSRCVLERGLERAGSSLAALSVVLELGSNAAIKDAVRRGFGIAFLSDRSVRRELEAREFRATKVRDLDLARQIYIVVDRRRPLSPAAAAFVQFVETHAGLADRHRIQPAHKPSL